MPYTPNLDLSKVAQGAADWHVDWGNNADILDAVIGKIKFTDDSEGTLTAGMVVCISAANTVNLANATDDTKSGVAICRTTDGVTVKIKQFGVAKDIITIGAGDIAPGDLVFLSTTLGKVTKTPPSESGNIVQVIGRAITEENSAKVDVLLQIDFNPLEV